MTILKYRVFFDTSVYIAALILPKGAAGELIRLVEAGVIEMVVSEKVIIESDEVLSAKFPKIVSKSRELWKHLTPEVIPDPVSKDVKAFKTHLSAADASILYAASVANVACFVTWNTRDFMKSGIDSLVKFPIVVPGQCLKLFREWIDPYLE